MGNIKYLKREGSYGKVDILLNDKLYGVEWGVFRLEELFGKASRGKRLKSSDRIYGDLPFVTAGEINEGISAYIGNDVTIFSKNTITIDMFGSAKYRNYFYGADDHVSIVHTEDISKLATVFITAAINKATSTGKFDYANNFYPKDADELIIQLPIKNNEVDYEFMESFIKDLEDDYVLELEESKNDKTDKYLFVSNLSNYNLTSQEQIILEDFINDSIEWREFRLEELFQVNSYKKQFDANKVNISDKGYPYVVRTSLNNGIKGYIDENEQFLNDGNTISFGQDTATMFYQEKPYFTGDKIKILKSKDNKLNKLNGLFFIATMTKSFNSFSWGTSSYNVNIISSQLIKLPIRNNEVDYEFMEDFITLVQKLIIKDFNILEEKRIKIAKEFIK